MENPDNIRDYGIKKGMSVSELVGQLGAGGFQASEIGEAVRLIKQMRREKVTVFLSFTANMVASGLRGIITKLVKERFVDVIITTGGSIDHDLIRTGKTYVLGGFDLDDSDLHEQGINRLGNILIPSDRFVYLEKKLRPFFRDAQKEKGIWTPSELIRRLGKTITDQGSFMHWASRNDIPVFCPGITDSALGLQLYFYKQDNPDFRIDVSGDMKLADIVINAEKTGGIILGGGIAKHHTIGVNILREGLDYAVYLTTASPFDGSLSGATPNEARSWSKIKGMKKGKGKPNTATVYGDATITFPLIMAKVFEQ